MTADPLFAPLAARRPRLPEGVRVYAVGDVHGRLDLLLEIEAAIDADAAAADASRVVQVMLGDYVDRGPDSRGVIAHLIARSRARELVALRGNHEAYVLDIAHAPSLLPRWLSFGGREMLRSYGLDLDAHGDGALVADSAGFARRALAAIAPGHLAFIAATRLHWRCGDYLFVHAGIRPGLPLEAQNEQDLLWIRSAFLDSAADHGAVVVHGHTPMPRPVIRANRIGIDTQAFSSGVLTCLVLDGATQRLIQTGDPGARG